MKKLLLMLLLFCVVLYVFNTLIPPLTREEPNFMDSYERLYEWGLDIVGAFDNLRSGITAIVKKTVEITDTAFDILQNIYEFLTGNGDAENA